MFFDLWYLSISLSIESLSTIMSPAAVGRKSAQKKREKHKESGNRQQWSKLTAVKMKTDMQWIRSAFFQLKTGITCMFIHSSCSDLNRMNSREKTITHHYVLWKFVQRNIWENKHKSEIHHFHFEEFLLSVSGYFTYLLVLWDDLMFLAEIMFRDRTASAALSSTSALFLIRPGGRQNGRAPIWSEL